MKRIFILVFTAFVATTLPAMAQDNGIAVTEGDAVAQDNEASTEEPALKPWEAHPENYELVDTVKYVKMQVLDSGLVNRNIFDLLLERNGRGSVRLNQGGDILSMMEAHFESNTTRRLTGYRVRIFFDNKQSARMDSEATMEKFRGLYPEIEVFRSYVNPYFKVTVGNYRTRSEAMCLLQRVKRAFPTAFIVREEIEYPALVSGREMVLDTVSFYRYIGPAEEAVAEVN